MSDEERWEFASNKWDEFREGLSNKKWDFTGIDDYSDLDTYKTFTDSIKTAFTNKDKEALKKELYRTGNLDVYNMLFWKENKGSDNSNSSDNSGTSNTSNTTTSGKKMVTIGDKSYDVNLINKFYTDLKPVLTDLQAIKPINVNSFFDYNVVPYNPINLNLNASDKYGTSDGGSVNIVNGRIFDVDDTSKPLIYRPDSKFTNEDFKELLDKLPEDDKIKEYLRLGETKSLFDYIYNNYDSNIMSSDLSEETKAKYKLLSEGIDGLKNYTHMYKGIIPITYDYDENKKEITRKFKYNPSDKGDMTKMFLEYVNYNTNPNKLEKGGVIKAKDGDSLQKLHDSIKRDRTNKTTPTSTPTKSNSDIADNFKPQAKPKAEKPLSIRGERVVGEGGKEKPFDDIDLGDVARITAVTSDIVGLVAGLIPGGSAVSAASGLVSTVGNATANYVDDMHWWDNTKNTLTNLSLDAASIIPYFGLTAKAAKTTKVLKGMGKTIVPLLAAAGAIEELPELNGTLNKLLNSDESLNQDDWTNLYTGFNMLTSAISGTVNSKRVKNIKNRAHDATPKDKKYEFTGKDGKTVYLSDEVHDSLNSIRRGKRKSKSELLEAQNEILKKADIKGELSSPIYGDKNPFGTDVRKRYDWDASYSVKKLGFDDQVLKEINKKIVKRDKFTDLNFKSKSKTKVEPKQGSNPNWNINKLKLNRWLNEWKYGKYSKPKVEVGAELPKLEAPKVKSPKTKIPQENKKQQIIYLPERMRSMKALPQSPIMKALLPHKGRSVIYLPERMQPIKALPQSPLIKALPQYKGRSIIYLPEKMIRNKKGGVLKAQNGWKHNSWVSHMPLKPKYFKGVDGSEYKLNLVDDSVDSLNRRPNYNYNKSIGASDKEYDKIKNILWFDYPRSLLGVKYNGNNIPNENISLPDSPTITTKAITNKPVTTSIKKPISLKQIDPKLNLQGTTLPNKFTGRNPMLLESKLLNLEGVKPPTTFTRNTSSSKTISPKNTESGAGLSKRENYTKYLPNLNDIRYLLTQYSNYKRKFDPIHVNRDPVRLATQKVIGDYIAKTAYNKRAESYINNTQNNYSDASLNIADRLSREYQANDLKLQGDIANSQAINKQNAHNIEIGNENTSQRINTANYNRDRAAMALRSIRDFNYNKNLTASKNRDQYLANKYMNLNNIKNMKRRFDLQGLNSEFETRYNDGYKELVNNYTRAKANWEKTNPDGAFESSVEGMAAKNTFDVDKKHMFDYLIGQRNEKQAKVLGLSDNQGIFGL